MWTELKSMVSCNQNRVQTSSVIYIIIIIGCVLIITTTLNTNEADCARHPVPKRVRRLTSNGVHKYLGPPVLKFGALLWLEMIKNSEQSQEDDVLISPLAIHASLSLLKLAVDSESKNGKFLMELLIGKNDNIWNKKIMNQFVDDDYELHTNYRYLLKYFKQQMSGLIDLSLWEYIDEEISMSVDSQYESKASVFYDAQLYGKLRKWNDEDFGIDESKNNDDNGKNDDEEEEEKRNDKDNDIERHQHKVYSMNLMNSIDVTAKWLTRSDDIDDQQNPNDMFRNGHTNNEKDNDIEQEIDSVKLKSRHARYVTFSNFNNSQSRCFPAPVPSANDSIIAHEEAISLYRLRQLEFTIIELPLEGELDLLILRSSEDAAAKGRSLMELEKVLLTSQEAGDDEVKTTSGIQNEVTHDYHCVTKKKQEAERRATTATTIPLQKAIDFLKGDLIQGLDTLHIQLPLFDMERSIDLAQLFRNSKSKPTNILNSFFHEEPAIGGLLKDNRAQVKVSQLNHKVKMRLYKHGIHGSHTSPSPAQNFKDFTDNSKISTDNYYDSQHAGGRADTTGESLDFGSKRVVKMTSSISSRCNSFINVNEPFIYLVTSKQQIPLLMGRFVGPVYAHSRVLK